MIKAIIFDIGGVLAYDVWEYLLLGKEGIASTYPLDRNRVQEIGVLLWDQFSSIYSTDFKKLEEEYWDQLTSKLDFDIEKKEIDYLTEKHIRPVEGMPQLLSDLKSRGIRLAVCSNNTEFWFMRQANKINLFQYVSSENIILSSRVGKAKASPGFEMFYCVIDSLGVHKNECLYIDDRIESIRQANKFGLTSILFPAESADGAPYLRKLFEALNIYKEPM